MARPRVVRKQEEASAIPVDQPIQVELPPEGVVEIPPQKITAASSSEAPPEKSKPDEVSSLKEQLEQLKKASEEQARQAREAMERESALRRQFEERGKEYQTVLGRADQAEMDAVANGIAAAQAEALAAEQEIQIAGEAQDWGAITKGQSKLSRAMTRLTQLEDAKTILEQRAKQPKERQIQPSGDPVEAHIEAMQTVNRAQKEWLKQHRELVTDGRKNVRLQNAHFDAEEKGLTAGSPEYFQFIEEKLGYRKPLKVEDDVEDDDVPPQNVSAPPSREAPSPSTGRMTPTRITLTAEERSAAAAAGISDVEYAKQKLKLLEMKRSGAYSEH